nr:outer membrane lipoprotein [Raoultella sp. NCTC 9187]
MRALPICLLALMLSGCSMLSRSPVEPVQSTATAPAKSEPAKPKAVRPAPVRIYTDASALVGKPFRDLGEVTGESCPGLKSGFTAEHPYCPQASAN